MPFLFPVDLWGVVRVTSRTNNAITPAAFGVARCLLLSTRCLWFVHCRFEHKCHNAFIAKPLQPCQPYLDMQEVTGSSPVSPIRNPLKTNDLRQAWRESFSHACLARQRFANELRDG